MGNMYVGMFVIGSDKPATHTYETDDTNFKNGEILLPDYVHLDTLVVTDAVFLNKWMKDYDVESDGDIIDLLRVSTKQYNKTIKK